jgi:hypothetical protein
MKRPVRRRPQDIAEFVIRLSGWGSWWSFHTNHGRREVAAYGHSHTVTFRGEVFRPEGFAYREATITLSGQRKLLDDMSDPPSIGTLMARDGALSGYAMVRVETMAALLSLASSNRLQILHIIGTPLKRWQALIRTVELHTEFESGDW